MADSLTERELRRIGFHLGLVADEPAPSLDELIDLIEKTHDKLNRYRRVLEAARRVPIATMADDFSGLACCGCGARNSDSCTPTCWVPEFEAALTASAEPTAGEER